MELVRSSETRNKALSQKFRLPCQSRIDEQDDTSIWLEIRQRLSNQSPILHGLLLEQNKDVVVKFGNSEIIKKEYSIAEELSKYNIPNIIKYYCSFICKDIFTTIGNRKYLCDPKGDENIVYIVMPYYSLGDLHKYPWKKDTLDQLKNILTQACYAVLYAYETCGFIHNDLHLYNILIRKTKKKTLTYGNIDLNIDTFYAIIMDFEKSNLHTGSPRDVYFTIRNMINLATSLDTSDLALQADISQLNKWMSDNTPITKNTYTIIKDIISKISILYERSKIPPNIFAK